MNIDENTMNNIKNMVDNGNISDAISQISPEMIQNFSKMFSQSQTQTQPENSNNGASKETSKETNESPNFDFSNIDINMLSKMSSMIGKMNNTKDDPRKNLLNSLRPYLRDSKKGKLDNYMNLLNMSQIAELMKNNDKENKNNV